MTEGAGELARQDTCKSGEQTEEKRDEMEENEATVVLTAHVATGSIAQQRTLNDNDNNTLLEQ